jgi:hypothetical protein
VREDYHSQWAWGTWKDSVQIHHNYSKISSNFSRFCQDSSSDYDPAPCKASKSEKKTCINIFFKETERKSDCSSHSRRAALRRCVLRRRGSGAPGVGPSAPAVGAWGRGAVGAWAVARWAVGVVDVVLWVLGLGGCGSSTAADLG